MTNYYVVLHVGFRLYTLWGWFRFFEGRGAHFDVVVVYMLSKCYMFINGRGKKGFCEIIKLSNQ